MTVRDAARLQDQLQTDSEHQRANSCSAGYLFVPELHRSCRQQHRVPGTQVVRIVNSDNLLPFVHQSMGTAHHLQALLPTYGAIRGQLHLSSFHIQAIIVFCRRALVANMSLIYSVHSFRG